MRKTLLSAVLLAWSLAAAEQVVYVGTYTGGNSSSKGIYSFRFDPATGKASAPTLAAESVSPSFLAIARNGKALYAVNEAGGGTVSAFAIEGPGKLRLLNTLPSEGTSPCHVNLDPSGKWLAVANYSSGSAAIFPVNADGSLGKPSDVVQHKGSGPNKGRQEGPHAHSVNFTTDGKFLFIADLGLDQVKVYAFDKKLGKLKEVAQLESPKGGGPRHASLGKNGLVYVVNELEGAVSSFRWNGGSGPTPAIATVSALPADWKGNKSGAEVLLDPSGKLVFSSNRGHDSIAVFETDPASGSLRFVEAVKLGIKTPRGFVISPDGKYLLAGGQDSDQVAVFRIDRQKKTLEKVGENITVGRPVCLRFSK
jgi:6-phosphogluconolactonase